MWIEVNDRECTYDIVWHLHTLQKSESKGTQIIMNASDCKRLQMNADEWNWVQASAIECKWMQVNANECDKWMHMITSDCKWLHVSACERIWMQLSWVWTESEQGLLAIDWHQISFQRILMSIDVSSRASK